MNRSLRDDIFVVPNEINFGPHITKKLVHVLLAKILGAVEPTGAEDADGEMQDSAFLVGVQSVNVRGAVVPFKIIRELAELVLDYVDVAAVGPVVPEVHFLKGSAVVHEQDCVELRRPWSWNWSCVC